MSALRQLQEDVAARMRRGDTFAEVESELIDPSELSDDEKAALWLYGWSFVGRRRQRREAMSHIDVLEADRAPAPLPRARLRLVAPSPRRAPTD